MTRRVYTRALNQAMQWYRENEGRFPGIIITDGTTSKINYDALQAYPDAYFEFLASRVSVNRGDPTGPRVLKYHTLARHRSALYWGLHQQEEYQLDASFSAGLSAFLRGVRKDEWDRNRQPALAAYKYRYRPNSRVPAQKRGRFRKK